MKETIACLSIVTASGAKVYRVGSTDFNGETIHKIALESLYFTGDPFDHYVGRNKKGAMIFSVNCLCPCDVEYFTNE